MYLFNTLVLFKHTMSSLGQNLKRIYRWHSELCPLDRPKLTKFRLIYDFLSISAQNYEVRDRVLIRHPTSLKIHYREQL